MRIISAALVTLLVFAVFVSCKKEKSFEIGAPAVGSLKSDNNGDCLPKTAVGAYIAGSALSDSNYLEVEVDVATAGSYSIRTDTVNGYSFSGIGNFEKTGINRIRLGASGTPTAAGEDQFFVIFDTSICSVPVTVLPEGSTNGPAAFTLQGAGDTCLSYSVSGDYVQNTPLQGSNTVAIKINATSPGTYTVTTNNVNEFQFAGSGTIAGVGEQTIILTGSGTPATEGPTVFTVSAGGTTCNFTVNVTASTGPPPPVGDLFPMTANSYWTYNNNGANVEDSFIVTNKGTVAQAGNNYSSFETTDGNNAVLDNSYYRKNGSDYYTYGKVDRYTSQKFDAEVDGEILFLKEGLAQNDTWNSAEFTGTMNGQPAKLQYVFTCTSVNGTASWNSVNYNNVTVVVAKPQVSLNGGAYVLTGEQLESYYAKGIGLIYQKGSAGGITAFETFILHYQVF